MMDDYHPFFLSSVLALGILFIFLFLFSFFTKKNPENSADLKLPPGNLGWPFIGELLDFIRGGRQKFFTDRMSKHSPVIFKTNLLGKEMAGICGPHGNKFVFSNEDKLFVSWWPYTMNKLFFSDGSTIPENAKKYRPKIYEMFKPDNLHKYVPLIKRITDQHLDQEWAPNSQVQVVHMCKMLTATLGRQLLIGIQEPKLEAKLGDHFNDLVGGMASFPINFPGTAFNRGIKASKEIRNELYNIIRKRRSDLSISEASNIQKQPYFLSQLLYEKDEDGNYLSEVGIADKMLMLFHTSIETSSAIMMFAVYYLAQNPHIYNLVLNEQLEIMNSKKPNELLNWEDVRKMKCTRNVVNETLRLAPGGQFGFKEVLADFTYAGYEIPKGWKMFWSSHTTHRNPEYFPDPENFDPTRFDGSGPIPYTFIPFGGGPRICPANEYARIQITIFLHCLVMKFKWRKAIPDEKLAGFFSPAPAHGLPVLLFPHGN